MIRPSKSRRLLKYDQAGEGPRITNNIKLNVGGGEEIWECCLRRDHVMRRRRKIIILWLPREICKKNGYVQTARHRKTYIPPFEIEAKQKFVTYWVKYARK